MTAIAQRRKLWLLERIAAEQDEKILAQMEMALAELLIGSDAEIPATEVLQAIARGRADREAGRVVSHESFMQAFDRGLAAGIAASK